MGVEKKIIDVLLDNKVCAVNFCCCVCRIVSAENCGYVRDVSADYA